MRPFFNFLLSLVLLCFLSACAEISQPPPQIKTSKPSAPIARPVPHAPVPAEPEETVRVGVLLPLSGESAQLGSALLDAAHLAVYDAYISTPPQTLRRKILLIPADTEGTAEGAGRAASAVLKQNVVAILGPIFSHEVSAAAPAAKAARVPLLSFSNHRGVASGGVYILGFSPEQQVARVVQHAIGNRLTRLGAVIPNDAYGQVVRDALARHVESSGGQLAQISQYAPKARDFRSEMERVLKTFIPAEQNPPQGILIADGGERLKITAQMLKAQAEALGEYRLLGTGMWDEPETLSVPELRGGWFATAPPQGFRIFEQRFAGAYGYRPVKLAGVAYDAAALLCMLAMSQGPAVLAAALTDPRGFEGVAHGVFRLNPDGTSQRALTVLEVGDGEFRIISPAAEKF